MPLAVASSATKTDAEARNFAIETLRKRVIGHSSSLDGKGIRKDVSGWELPVHPDFPLCRFATIAGNRLPAYYGDCVACHRLDGAVQSLANRLDVCRRIDCDVCRWDGQNQPIIAVAHDLD